MIHQANNNEGSGFALLVNPKAKSDAQRRVDAPISPALDDDAFNCAWATITQWQDYAETPLYQLPSLADEAGVGAVYYKDEGNRFGLGSFKALGGAYAVLRQLINIVGAATGKTVTGADLASGKYRKHTENITVCCATDGNHGRSVAWGAQTFGCQCVIFIHSTVSEARKAAIAHFGAQVVRTPGNYDQSVAIAQETAVDNDWIVVSDTSYPGYTQIPKDVMSGYEIMAAEAFNALASPPTHIFLQTGVGGMAAAVASHSQRRYGDDGPKIILADPVRSACWYESLSAGKPTTIEGDLDTIMAGLACGEVSLLAWDILATAADAVVTVADAQAIDCMRRLAELEHPGPIVAGESAVAGLAALLAVSADDEARQSINLTGESTVLLFGTERDTDAELYTRLVGRPARDVVAARG